MADLEAKNRQTITRILSARQESPREDDFDRDAYEDAQIERHESRRKGQG